jgi:hypothetical protein
MKEFFALVAVVLCLLVAYQIHRDRLAAGKEKAASEIEVQVVKKPLSQYLEPYRKDLFAALDERRPVDFVPPLEALQRTVEAKRHEADGSTRAICEVGLVAVEQMLQAARQRNQSMQELLQLSARPTSSLERSDSAHTSRSFFRQGALRNAEAAVAQKRAGVEQAFARLQQVEGQVIAAHGVEAAQENYGQRPPSKRHLQADGRAGPGNPLDRSAYDQRQVIVPRSERQEPSANY